MVLLDIPEPPEGESWKYALIGQAVADTPEGKVLIKRLEDQDVYVEVLQGGGYTLQTQPQIPADARIRMNFKEQNKI